MIQPSHPAPRSFDQIPLLPGTGRSAHLRFLRDDRLGFMRALAAAEGMTRLRFLKKVVAITTPALIQEVLVEKARSFNKSSFIRYLLYPLAGEGLFTSNGELWRRQRRLMAPIFQPGQIVGFAEDMVACAQRTVDSWQDGAEIDLFRETTRIAMSVAGKTLFQAETFSESDEIGAALTTALTWASDHAASIVPVLQSGLREALEGTSARLSGRARALLRDAAARLHGPVLLLGPEGRRLRAAVAALDQRVQRMIDERRAAGLGRPDLLSRLLSARDEDDGETMSDRQVRDEILTLFVAGHETTATGLAWSLYLLCRHPDILQRVRAEADALGRPPRYEDLPRLQLSLQVFKEALRLYPPVPLFSRESSAEVEIGGYQIPAGTVIFLSPYATHRRPELWPDPERFDPGRFAPSAEEGRHRHSYLSFSAGPRVCIGNHFALMEGPLVLCRLLQCAEFSPLRETVEPEVSATLRPSGGVPMRVRLRRTGPTLLSTAAAG